MSWIQKLCETYENAARTDAVSPDAPNPLPVPGFIADEMELTVTLSADGDFVDADRTPEGQIILVPCTLKSGVARQNPVSPHPIFDSIKYLGTDEQMKILSDWCNFGAPKAVHAVHSYLAKGTLKDNIEKALSEKKVKWKDSDGDGVRFCVLGAQPNELWRNASVLDSWQKYFEKNCLGAMDKSLCYALGQTLPITTKHPTALGTLLLISMTIDRNCEGIFIGSTKNAVSVSAEATLKAHNTLKWLIRRQGRYLDRNTVLLTWGTGAEILPDITEFDPEDDEFAPLPEETKPQVRTMARQAKAVADGSHGYDNRLLKELEEEAREKRARGEHSEAVVMVLDSTTGNGRASIAYYQELDILDYLQNLRYWYNTCKWPMKRQDTLEEKPRTPLPQEIGDLIYGERGGDGDRKLKRQLSKRLIPCITARRPLPPDIMMAAFRRAVNPAGFRKESDSWDKEGWERAVAIACALIRKYYMDKEEVHPMELDESSTERNYLFGRLLAVADVVEELALSGQEKGRQTNAVRYMQRFQQRPLETWNTLRSGLIIPYLRKLKNGTYFTRLMDDITNLFEPGDMALQKPLDGRFLEGYSNQKRKLYAKNDKTLKSMTMNEEDENNGSADE